LLSTALVLVHYWCYRKHLTRARWRSATHDVSMLNHKLMPARLISWLFFPDGRGGSASWWAWASSCSMLVRGVRIVSVACMQDPRHLFCALKSCSLMFPDPIFVVVCGLDSIWVLGHGIEQPSY
jgi:hypothetical protein